jgi:hypothetical protein
VRDPNTYDQLNERYFAQNEHLDVQFWTGLLRFYARAAYRMESTPESPFGPKIALVKTLRGLS